MVALIFEIGVNPDGAEKAPDQGSALEKGYFDEGSASGPVGATWDDSSKGTCYGGGHRYEDEETAFMAKVPGRNR